MLPKKEFDEIVENTERVKKWLTWLFLGAVLLTVGSAFGATYGFQDQAGNRVTLHDTDCHVPFLKGWRTAKIRYQGQDFQGCWVASHGIVFVVDEAGDVMPIPREAFTKLQEG
jgi:hypothetical protein